MGKKYRQKKVVLRERKRVCHPLGNKYMLCCPDGGGGTPSNPGWEVPHPVLDGGCTIPSWEYPTWGWMTYPHPGLNGVPPCPGLDEVSPPEKNMGPCSGVLWDGVPPVDRHLWKQYLPHPLDTGSNKKVLLHETARGLPSVLYPVQGVSCCRGDKRKGYSYPGPAGCTHI